MYGGGGGATLGGHTPGPCQASRLPPHNPRLHAPPKHGHVRQPLTHFTKQSEQFNVSAPSASDQKTFLVNDGCEVEIGS